MNTPENPDANADSAAQTSPIPNASQDIPGFPCTSCGRSLPAESPCDLCPYCLLATEILDETDQASRLSRNAGFEAPKIEELQPYFPSMEIAALVGQGGMGAVFRAHQKSLGRDVALKILLPEIAASPGFVERFMREARALARLGHPNIVAVFDHGTSGPYAYLVMELVEGINLREFMAGEKLPAIEAMRIIPQLCEALYFAHGRGVVHRDIKPENILIDEAGRVRITDFGLAKITEAGQNARHTGTRQVMGTVHYMAPEQIEQPTEVDHRADLYSLGVVFYELLTGELPLGRFGPPSEKAGTTRQVDKVVFKSLEKERDRRYDSAEEIRSDLDRSQKLFPGGEGIASVFHEAIKKQHRPYISAFLAVTWLVTTPFLLLFSARGGPAEFVLTLLFAVAAAYGVKKIVSVWPLPTKAEALKKPFDAIPKISTEWTRPWLESFNGLKMTWLVPALVAYVFGLTTITVGFVEHVPLMFLIAIVALIAAFLLIRQAFPADVAPKTRTQHLLANGPALTVIAPIGFLLVAWPSIPGIGMAFFHQGTNSVRFLAGVISLQLLWFTALALSVALFPNALKWVLKPMLNEWQGRHRWSTFLLSAVATFVSGAIYFLAKG